MNILIFLLRILLPGCRRSIEARRRTRTLRNSKIVDFFDGRSVSNSRETDGSRIRIRLSQFKAPACESITQERGIAGKGKTNERFVRL